MLRKGSVYFSFFVSRHWVTGRDATAFHGIEAQPTPDKIEVTHYFVASIDALGDDVREGLPEEAGPMENKAKPVKAQSCSAASAPFWLSYLPLSDSILPEIRYRTVV